LGGGSLRGQGSMFLRDPISTGPASSLSRNKRLAWPTKARARNGACRLSRRPLGRLALHSRHDPISSSRVCTPLRSPQITLSLRLRPKYPRSWTRSAQKSAGSLRAWFSVFECKTVTFVAANIGKAPRRTPWVLLPARRNAQAAIHEPPGALWPNKVGNHHNTGASENSIKAL
jgi:hypothetical protein